MAYRFLTIYIPWVEYSSNNGTHSSFDLSMVPVEVMISAIVVAFDEILSGNAVVV